MTEDEKLNYRFFLFKEFNSGLKKQMHNLAVKLIQCETNACIVTNERNVFVENPLKCVKELVNKYNCKELPIEILSRLMQFFSINIPELKKYKVNVLTLAYSL